MTDHLSIITCVGILISTVALIKCKDVRVIGVYFIMLFWIFMIPLAFFDYPIASRDFSASSEYDLTYFVASLVFSVAFFLTLSFGRTNFSKPPEITIRKSHLFAILGGSIIMYFAISNFSKGSLFSGQTYRELTEGRSSIAEYCVVIYLFALGMTKKRMVRVILITIMALYAISALQLGLRLQFISAAIALFITSYGFAITNRVKYGIIIAIVFMITLGLVRSGASFATVLNLSQIFLERGAVTTTWGGAYVTSKYYGYFVESLNGITAINGLFFLLGDLISIFTTERFLPNALNFKQQVTELYDVPGGSWIAGWFISYGNVITFSFITLSLCLVLTKIWSLRNIWPIFAILYICYLPRTLLYDWTTGFKMMFVACLCYFMISLLPGK